MRKFCLLVVVILLIGVLVGCSGGSSGSSDSVKVSGDDTLTPEIISLLKAIGTAFVEENANLLANNLDFPFTLKNDFLYTETTYDNYNIFLTEFGDFGDINIKKYHISGANFQTDDGITGIVKYNAYIYISVPGVGSGAENDLIELKVVKIDGKWKCREYYLKESMAASSLQSLKASSERMIFGPINNIFIND